LLLRLHHPKDPLMPISSLAVLNSHRSRHHRTMGAVFLAVVLGGVLSSCAAPVEPSSPASEPTTNTGVERTAANDSTMYAGRGSTVQTEGIVTGTVTWPNGDPAANAEIDIYPNGYPYAGSSGGEFTTTTDAAGRYLIQDCGCNQLGATFHLGADRNGGYQCYIMMYAVAEQAFEVSAPDGGNVDWRMVDMPCSQVYLTPQSLQKNLAILKSNPQRLSGGSWQQAEQRTQG
jgi:hypothetical protein